MVNLFPWKWKLSNGFPAKNIPHHGAKVFTCFAGGGGSSMGYKLAGYDVIGFNEIDSKQAKCYEANLGGTKKQHYIEDIRTFRMRDNLPVELFDLDILDGSPPCTTFSMSGKREKTWGVKRKFMEGKAEQTLDDLSFEFVKLADKLKPKIVIIENVNSMLLGNAIKYVAEIIHELKISGYLTTKYVLNSMHMGVPQSRKRLFILSIRKDLTENIITKGLCIPEPVIDLKFKEILIPFSKLDEGPFAKGRPFPPPNGNPAKYWRYTKPGSNFATTHPTGALFNHVRISKMRPLPTICSHPLLYHPEIYGKLTRTELIHGGTFPEDYNFSGSRPNFIIGMSVPPIMIAQIAWRIKQQWLDKIKQAKENYEN